MTLETQASYKTFFSVFLSLSRARSPDESIPIEPSGIKNSDDFKVTFVPTFKFSIRSTLSRSFV